MNRRMKELIENLLENKIVLQSWGIANIQIQDSSITFDVNGMKYCGPVFISIVRNGYEVRLDSKSFEVSSGNIISALDNEIEKTNNYLSDLQEWLRVNYKQ